MWYLNIQNIINVVLIRENELLNCGSYNHDNWSYIKMPLFLGQFTKMPFFIVIVEMPRILYFPVQMPKML